MPPVGQGRGGSDSLAQSAREKEIGQVRWILIVVGILTLGANFYRLGNVADEVMQALHVNHVAPEDADSFVSNAAIFCYTVYGGAALLGLPFILMGIIVKKSPVVITIIGLVLYLVSSAVLGLIAPGSLARGFIVKLLMIASLIWAIKAAFAYAIPGEKAAATEAYLE
ncbi:MAG: hypothetical protein U0800_25525 [Isosphaeraceae bacterium]